MFNSNIKGKLFHRGAYDRYGRSAFLDPISVPAAQVHLKQTGQKTSVRADSSASRGAADEIVSDIRLLFPPYVQVKIGDEFELEELRYHVISVHRRRTVFGRLDHIECDLALIP